MAHVYRAAITIIGAGSIGLLLAADLAAAGIRTTIVARTREQADAISRRGIAVRESGGLRRESRPLSVWAEDAIGLADGQPATDWAVLCVKQPELDEQAIETALRHAGERGRIVALQNGIGHEQRLTERIDPSRLRIAVTSCGARRMGASSVDRTGTGLTSFGAVSAEEGRLPDERDKQFASVLTTAGWRCEWADNLQKLIWDKLTVNAIINPLTALLRVPNGRLGSSPDTLALMRELYMEIDGLRRAEGIEGEPGLWERLLEVCRKTSDNHSSMLQDVERGRQTELEWITGSLLKMAEARGMRLNVNETLYRLLKASMVMGAGVERDVRDMGVDR